MIIKRKKLKKYQPNGYSKAENIEKSSPGFHSTSTSFESFKTFSDDDRDMQDLKNLAVGGGLGIGAGALIGKGTRKALDSNSLSSAKGSRNDVKKKYEEIFKKETGTTIKDITKKHDSKIADLKKKRIDRDSTSLGAAFLDWIDGGKDKKRDLERIDREIKAAEGAKTSEINSYIRKTAKSNASKNAERKEITKTLEDKLKRNRRIGLGVGIGSAATLGGLGLYGMYKHNQKKRNSGEKRSSEKSSIEEALGRSSEEVASGRRDPRFHNFHNLPKEKREEHQSIIPTKGSIINSLKSGDPEELKEKFHKLKDAIANTALAKNLGSGLKDGFSGFSDNIKHNLFGNDK